MSEPREFKTILDYDEYLKAMLRRAEEEGNFDAAEKFLRLAFQYYRMGGFDR